MSLTIGQMSAVSYPALLNEMRKPENQWAESTLFNEMEKQGMIQRVSLGPTIEAQLDYKRNPGADFLATDMTPVSQTKTEVIAAASFTPAQLSVPVVWSKFDEATNPTETQKVPLVRSLAENGINSHDDMIEEALFATSTDGFLGVVTIIPDNGQGSVGGIDSGIEAWWRSQTANYLADGSDMEAQLTVIWNAAAKGSGSTMAPSLLFSGSSAHALFESTQTPLQRYGDQDFKVGAKSLMFKTAKYVFSQYGGTRVYFANKRSLKLVVSKQFFRDKSETQEFPNANGFGYKVYSALQLVTNNKSRLGVAVQV